MYDSFFDFKSRPFSAAPHPAFYYPVESIETARKNVSRCIERSEGPALIVGSAGSGKTLLCRMIADEFRSSFDVVMLAVSRICSRRTLLQAILFELGLPYRQMEEGELRLSLIDFLRKADTVTSGMLLIVDEAHSLPVPLLDELRMITNLVRDGKSRVRLVLAGMPELEEKFANPTLNSLSQRLAARCYLEPLNRDQTVQFVRFQISQAGGDANQILTEAALAAVYDATQGIPRLINQLCDHALVMAALGSQYQVSDTGVQEAWADLQQLPAADFGPADESQADANFIEFGGLDSDQETNHNQETNYNEETTLEEPECNPPVVVESDLINPSEQLDQIERQMATVSLDFAGPESTAPGPNDDEFQPVARIGQVSDSAISNASNVDDPFAETFDEEEIVVDRFTSLEDSMLFNVPKVTCEEAREINSYIPTFTAPDDSRSSSADIINDVQTTLDRTEHIGRQTKMSADDVSREDPFSVHHPDVGLDNQPDPDMQSDSRLLRTSEGSTRPKAMELDPVSVVDGLRNLDSSSPNPVDIVQVDDRELIVVDDHVNSKPEPKSDRRHEFRRLFANMRRGYQVAK